MDAFGMRYFVWLLLLPVVALATDGRSEEDDARTLAAGRVAADGPGLLRYFRQRTTAGTERDEIAALVRKLGDDSYSVRERATDDLIARGLPAIGLLKQALTDPDTEIARRAERCLKGIEVVPGPKLSAAAARMVARRKPDGAVEVLLAFLPIADDGLVVEEVRDALAAVALRDGKLDQGLANAVNSSSPAQRGLAGEVIVRAGQPAPGKLLNDPDLDVRLRVTLASVTTGKEKTSVPLLINLLAELPQGKAWQAEQALIRIAGDQSPLQLLGPDEAGRRKCRDAWAEWWKQHGERVDLSQAPKGDAWGNLTLIIQSDMKTSTGRIMEINGNKEIMWQFTEDLQLPQDAAIVGKDRLLVAEWGNRMQGGSGRVTLRDFQGKIHWQKAIHLPMTVQALPQGHVLVGNRRQFVEWDDKQNQVFASPLRNTDDIVAVTKDKDGSYVFITSTAGYRLTPGQEPKQIAMGATVQTPIFGGVVALSGNRILVTRGMGVAEFDAEGKIIWESPGPAQPTSVQRLPSGNTLVTAPLERKVLEIDRQNTVVWEYQVTDNMAVKRAHRR